MNAAGSAILWLAELPLRGLRRLLAAVRLEEAFANACYDAGRRVLRAVGRAVFHIEVRGAEHVPAGPAVFAANHQSCLDPFALVAALPARPAPPRLAFMAKAEAFRTPLVRTWLRIARAIPIERRIERAGEASGTASEKVSDTVAPDGSPGLGRKDLSPWVNALAGGRSVLIFPEGTMPGEEWAGRSDVDPADGLLPMKTGAVRIALAAGVPIVPVSLSGVGRACPPERLPRMRMCPIPRAGPIRVVFHPPIAPEPVPRGASEEAARAHLHAQLAAVRAAISAGCDRSMNLALRDLPRRLRRGPPRDSTRQNSD